MLKLTRKNSRKIVSLSALGAGAIAFGTGDASATVMFGTPNYKLGFDSGYNTAHFSTVLSGSHKLFFQAATTRNVGGNGSNAIPFLNQHSVKMIESAESFLRVFGAGATFNANLGGNMAGVGGTVAARSWTHTVPSSMINPHDPDGGNFSNQYALFSLPCTAGTCYGWLELSLMTSAGNAATGIGPDLTIEEWAFDTTGAQLAAGSGVSSGIPEPASFVLAGLGALVLGAVGVRRWRMARRG